MKVTSKLADVDFRFGRIERRGTTLLINSHSSQPMQTTVHMSPDDFLAFLKAMVTSRSALFFLFAFPILLLRHRSGGNDATEERGSPQAGHAAGDPW